MSNAAFTVLLVVVVAALIYKRTTDKNNQIPLPPGPPGHWLFGNQFPSHVWRQLKHWTDEYGPVITLRRGKSIMIVIGSHQAAADIMEKDGVHLVDRPASIAGGETLSGGMRVLLIGVGEKFKKYRKALHAQLQPKMAEEFQPVQLASAKNVVLDIIEKPDEHIVHARRYAASVIMSLTYGKTTPTSYSDPEVQAVNKCLARLGAVLRPGAYLVDTFPILRYVPGYLSQLKEFHREELQLFREQLDVVRKNMADGTARPSFGRYLLENQAEFDLSFDEAAYLAGSMFGAGSDTTAAAISYTIMAAACFPETQARVQEELDTVVGRERCPTFEDQDILPQTTAFMLETYRWRPVSAAGFMHRATKDIIWKNYRIPAGATVLGNHWAIARDPEVYPDPEKFDPQRWLTAEGTVREDIKFFNFGFGRRICPGLHVANRSVFINTALLLWAFRVSEDPSRPIDVNSATNTANVHPNAFKVHFEHRVKRLRELVTHDD